MVQQVKQVALLCCVSLLQRLKFNQIQKMQSSVELWRTDFKQVNFLKKNNNLIMIIQPKQENTLYKFDWNMHNGDP